MVDLAQAAGDLMEQGSPAFEAAIPILSQLLKAETAEREVRSVAYQLKAARLPVYKDLTGFDLAIVYFANHANLIAWPSRGRRCAMAFNLFIAYDLMSPGQNYEAVRDCIKDMGLWHQFQLSLFYVNTELSPAQAFDRISMLLDSNDRLAVIDANSGVVSNWDHPPIDAINSIWTQG